jgi:hypothetical protein
MNGILAAQQAHANDVTRHREGLMDRVTEPVVQQALVCCFRIHKGI